MDCWRTNKKRYRVYLIPKKTYPKVVHKDRFLNLIPVQYIFEYLCISLNMQNGQHIGHLACIARALSLQIVIF